MAAIYPSLEDMQVDAMIRAQTGPSPVASAPYESDHTLPHVTVETATELYPGLAELGLEITPHLLHELDLLPPRKDVVPASNSIVTASGMVAPVSGHSQALAVSHITQGVREVVLCKDGSGRIGIRVSAIHKGVFVVFVEADSPAALAGMRFGDQILSIDSDLVAGMEMSKVHRIFKTCPVNGIRVAVRDRPLERTVTIHKSSTGCLGFQFASGKITAIVKDSSAARNGLLIEHQVLEVNGRNVVGMKDKELKGVFESAGSIVTIAIMPSFLYDHMIGKMSKSLFKVMDHSDPLL